MKKPVAVLLLCLLLSPPYLAAQPPISSVGRLQSLMDELEDIQRQREALMQNLEENNEELLKALDESEASLKRQIEISNLFGDLIDEQAIYIRKLERSSKFWKIISGALAASLATTLIIRGASK